MAKGGDFVGFVHAAVQDRDVIAAIAQPVRDRHARRAASPDQQGLHMRDSQAARPCIMSWLSCAPSLLSGTGRSRWKKPLSAARSAERRVGEEGVSTGRFRGSPYY